MIALLAAHLCAAMLAPWLVGRLRRRALPLLALAPASAVVWAVAHTGSAFSDTPPTEKLAWIPGLDLDLWFRMDPLSWVMTLIVGGVGAIVLVYSSGYFSDSSAGLGRFAGAFTGFAGAMLGVVTTDQTMGLYLFWEATSLLSFLLIGYHHDRRPARAAARQALLITSSGSLAMFAGFVMLGMAPGGSFRLSELVRAAAAASSSTGGGTGGLDVTSPLVMVGALLVLVGAFSKSALVPFHFWLPGAMAAPTPVSAYLHSASMVKAGVYLVARLTPGFTEIPGWSPLIVAVGLATLLVGGYRALRQYDLKLVLAYGTVSQLGLITAAVGQGSAGAMAAGLTMLVAHSFFKSALFLTVGAIESATGTRDLRDLTGLARCKPLLAGAAGLAALSMAGVPLTTGYLGKEALLSAILHGSGAAWVEGAGAGAAALDVAVAVVVVLGSTLTVAYAWRMWWGAFGTRRTRETPPAASTAHADRTVSAPAPTPAPMRAAIVVLSAGALLGLAPHALETALAPPGQGLLPGTAHLAWWSGWEPALATALVLLIGAGLAAAGSRVNRVQDRLAPPVAITDVFSWSLRELEILSARLTRLTQRGSLPWDLSTILVTLVAGVAVVLYGIPLPSVTLRAWDSLPQVGIAAIIIASALLVARSRRRMRAVFALGGVGLGVALLYAAQGAPDLALTQIVVESVSIVVFVLVLRKMPRYFSDRPLATFRWWRLLIGLVIGIGVVVVGVYATAARIHAPVSDLMAEEAESFGHGLNIVNVTLVDIRAWDTVGEISVLLVTATGVASLIYGAGRGVPTGRATNVVAKPVHPNTGSPSSVTATPPDAKPGGTARDRPFLPAVAELAPKDRSTVLEVCTRLLFPTMLVISVWLLFIGHNNPGGGFAGGVVAGIAFVLRYLAGGRFELVESMPAAPGSIMGFGLFIAGVGALSPLAFGNAVLESTPVDLSLGVLGELHFTTAMVLDVGVYVLVLGLVLGLVSSAGAEIDRQSSGSSVPVRPIVGATAPPAGREGTGDRA